MKVRNLNDEDIAIDPQDLFRLEKIMSKPLAMQQKINLNAERVQHDLDARFKQ
jgi:hypothetical protein